MSSPSRALSYAAVLRTPHAARAFSAALVGRLSYGIVFLSLLLAITRATGSYAAAGGVMALFGATSCFLSPVRAKLVDRHGPHRALPPMTVAYALLLAGIAVATWQPGTPNAVLWILGGAAGTCTPPLGPVMRTLWRDLVPDRDLLQRAYSLDTVAEELLYVTGPLLAGLIMTFANPALGVAVSAGLVLVGTLLLVASPAVRIKVIGVTAGTAPTDGFPKACPGPARAGERRGWLRGGPGLRRSILVSCGVGLCLGALNLLVVAFAEQENQLTSVAWVEASLAAGSAIGGLAYGAYIWRVSATVRLPLLAIALGLSLAAAGLSANLYVLVAVVGFTGLFVAPVLTTAYLIADESAAPDARTQAGAWVNTAFNAGASAGTAGVGLLLGRLPLALCFAIAAAPAVLSALAALSRVRWASATSSLAPTAAEPIEPPATTGEEPDRADIVVGGSK